MTLMNKVIMIGAGGHGKVVLSTLLEVGMNVISIYDDDVNKLRQKVFNIPIIGPVSDIEDSPSILTIIAIGDNQKRKKIASKFKRVNYLSVVHPNAYVHNSVRIGAGTIVFAGAVIQPDTLIGEHCIVNTGATVDHDCVVGNFSHLAPGTHLSGGVKVYDGVLFGIGSMAIPGMSIGAWSTIGAGSVVVKSIASYNIVAGVPAKSIK